MKTANLLHLYLLLALGFIHACKGQEPDTDVNQRSLMALNVPYSNQTPGTKLEQWFENQYDAELWQIIP